MRRRRGRGWRRLQDRTRQWIASLPVRSHAGHGRRLADGLRQRVEPDSCDHRDGLRGLRTRLGCDPDADANPHADTHPDTDAGTHPDEAQPLTTVACFDQGRLVRPCAAIDPPSCLARIVTGTVIAVARR